MSFQNQRPSSRRDRRRQRNSRREPTQQSLDRSFFLIVGAFVLIVLLFLATYAYFRA